MSDKKSLGSSPIGYSTTGIDSYQFIPDLGVSAPSQRKDHGNSETETKVETEKDMETKKRKRKRTSISRERDAGSRWSGPYPKRRPPAGSGSSGDGAADRASKAEAKPKPQAADGKNRDPKAATGPSEEKSPEKKIVSYYLEKDLVRRLKTLADEEGIYYSTAVNDAIRTWVEDHDY